MIGRQNRALIALIFLTGMRDGAVITLRCKHVFLQARQINQDAKEVRTKFGKNMRTTWFPVGADIEQIVVDWVEERLASGAGPEAPLFPATPSAILSNSQADQDSFWTTTGPVREIFRQACTAAEIRYFHPHLFRKTLTQLAEKICRSPEEFKAWSQNLGHEKVATTFEYYGRVDSNRQDELIQSLASLNEPGEREQELIKRYRAASPEVQTAIMTLVSK